MKKYTEGTIVLFYNAEDKLELVRLTKDTEFEEVDVVSSGRAGHSIFKGAASIIIEKDDKRLSISGAKSGVAVDLILNQEYELINVVFREPHRSLFTRRHHG